MTTTTSAPTVHGSGEEKPGLSQGQIVRKRFIGNTAAVTSLVVFVLILALAYTAGGFFGIPGWWKYSHNEVNDLLNGGRPTLQLFPFSLGEHPFGQDRLGRDTFAQTMRGVQISVTVMFIIGIVGGTIGVVVGALAGYFRGWVDNALMRMTDVVIVIPLIILAAVLGQVASRSVAANLQPLVLGLMVGLIAWTGLARLVRAEFLSLREREFVDAARIAGASSSRIIFRHILPNAVGVIIVFVTLSMSSAILLETSLSYIGMGVKAPDVSLGLLISQNQEAFSTRPWLFWWPGMFIVAICLCINFIGDGLRDAFDPRQKKFNAKKARDTTAGPRKSAGPQAKEQ
ncbi:binding-protein-dependent transport system inner membrane protein [Arthrobacter crystallopoietes BAB-32]|uniref:Oligopeptide transport system permease protein OppC n=1 Tax=Arthrobacter crystallopoietes BAB-32 TaxID=1246476 RepID=N1V5X2_9MICC|nr:ABC transporter permease [Arthrobacter crystallopoietes]EMY35497.1 binding-protein-dependent transport system inner membrane protein [Arthrobacter crystallopoietes BAB-32]